MRNKFLNWIAAQGLSNLDGGDNPHPTPKLPEANTYQIYENLNKGEEQAVKDALLIQHDYDKQKATQKGVVAAVGAALAFPPTRKLAARILKHPITEAVGTATGFYNLATDQGVQKTIDHAKNGEYGKAVLSGLGDVLDASPLLGVLKGAKAGYNALRAGNGIKNAAKTFVDNAPILKFGRMFSKANRAKHAFVTINPFGYEKPFKRGFKWLNSVLSDAPVDPNTFSANIAEFSPHLDPDWVPFWNKNREDAWRIYNGLEQKYSTYVKNADGTYSYNLPEIIKRRPHKKIDWGAYDGNKFGKDDIGGNHGGLTGHTTVEMGDGKTVHYIEDVWDLHPFSRIGDGMSSRIATGLSVPAGETLAIGKDVLKGLGDKGIISTRSARFGKASLDDRFRRLKNWAQGVRIPWLDNWFSNLEVGKIIGGTPFTMKTRVPTKTIMQHLYSDVYFPEQYIDDAVDYVIPKEPLQLKLNFEDFTKSLENIK